MMGTEQAHERLLELDLPTPVHRAYGAARYPPLTRTPSPFRCSALRQVGPKALGESVQIFMQRSCLLYFLFNIYNASFHRFILL